jgi:hypothetical protein
MENQTPSDEEFGKAMRVLKMAGLDVAIHHQWRNINLRVRFLVEDMQAFDIDTLKRAPDKFLPPLKDQARRIFAMLGGTADEIRELDEKEAGEAAS